MASSNPAKDKPSKASKPVKLSRAEIRAGLDQVPIETLLSSGKGKTPQLTHKQREFARAIALGQTKAQAYRGAYKENPAPSTIANTPYMLARNPRIVQEIEAYKLALEAEKHRTPAQLKALLVQQLVQHSLDEDFPPAQRVQCLKLIGTLFEVGAFVELKQTTTINKSDDIRARLLKVLGSHAVDVEAKPVAHDDGASLLAELAAAPVESGMDDPDPTGTPPNGRSDESPRRNPRRNQTGRDAMKYTESDYINAGHAYEKGRKAAETLRHMLEAETPDDRAEARRLIEQGRQEARRQ